MKTQPIALAQWPSLTAAEAAQVVGGAAGPWSPFWKKALTMAVEVVLEAALKEWKKHSHGDPRRVGTASAWGGSAALPGGTPPGMEPRRASPFVPAGCHWRTGS